MATQPCWIPVAKKMPDTNGRYLITKKGYPYVEIEYCSLDYGRPWGKSHDVIAWMPLPERYEGSEEEK